MSLATTPLRYIPLPRTLPIYTYTQHRIPLYGSTETSHASLEPIPTATLSAFSFEVASMIIYVILISLLLILTIALLVIPREPSSRQNSIVLRTPSTSYGERELCTDYVYNGIRAILRRVYLDLRRRFRCPKCTPRELAYLSGVPAIARFADVYEDVVYGAKNRQDIDAVLKEVES